ncbi:unnamed protein product [Bathycoccus prasinos]
MLRMPARRTTTLEKKKTKKNTSTTTTTDVNDDNDEEKTTKKGEKKKQKSQQKQQFLQEKKNVGASSFSSSLYSKDPLKSLQTSEEDKEEFVNFLLKEEEDKTISLQVSMQFVRDAVREYPGVKLNKELLEDTEAALAFFGGSDRGGGFFIEEEEEEDDDDTGNENELKQPRRRLQNFLKLEDFEEMIDETTGARTVLLTIPSSKEEDAAATKRTVLLNTLKISEQNREIGEREERARRKDLLEAKKKLVSQANTTAAAKGKTTSSGGVGKKKAGTKSSAAAIKKKKDDDEGEMKIGGEDKDEDKQEEKDEILPDGDDILSGSCAATRRFNSGKFQLDQSKKIHGAIADDKVFKFLREFKKEVYETYRLRSLVEKMDFSSDDDNSQKSVDRENVLECIRIWINMRGMVVSARLALIEREKFLKDCEAMSKFASDYRKDTKTVSKASVQTEKATAVVAPSKMKATDATTTTILKEIPTYSIANRSLSSWSILLNEDDEALLDDEYVEKNDIDDDIDDDDNQHVLTIEDQLESEIKTYEQEQTFNQMIIKGHLAHVTPAGEEFSDATAKLEKALEKVLRSPSLSTKTSHDRDRLLASTKWSADQTMVFDDLILLCDNAYFPSNEKACKAADDINRHVLYRAVSVLKKAFEILSDFVDKDLVVGGFKKSAARLFSSTLEQTYRRQFSNMLNNILDPYDTLIDCGAETKLLMFVRMRVTNAMEIDSDLRERAHQTVISACLEQMLSGKFDQFSRQKTEKFIEELLFEEETEEEEEKKKKAAKSSSSSSKKKKKKSNKAGKDTPALVSEKKGEVSDKEDDDEKEEEGKEEEQGKEEVTPTPTLVVPVALQESEEFMEEENLEAWQEVKKVRGAKTSPSSVIVAPKDLVVSKVKISPVKKIPAAKQQQQQRSELSSSPPLPKSPPPKEVVTAAVEKKREVTRRALFVDTLKKNETAPAPTVVVEEETKEKEEEEAREEEEQEEQQQKVADDKEESNDTYVVRSVSDIEQSFCAASNPPPDQQQHYHHHHQHYQPPLPQMPPPQMVDGQRVIFVPMIIPDSGSMPHPMPFGMHHHHSMAPPLPPPMPRLPDTSEAVVSMYNKFYYDVMMQQQYSPPPPTQRSSSSNIGAATNEAVSDTASTASDDHPCAAAAKSSSSSSSSSPSPPLPKTPPPKGQQQMIQHHKSASSSPSMSPSASSSSIRIPSPRPIDLARISSAAFPKPRRSSREYRRDNHHHNHGNDSNDDRNSNSKREEEFPALSKDKIGGKASNVMSLAKSNKSWAEAQMELKGTSLPSLTSSPMKPPSLPQQHHQMQRQVA